VHAIEKKTEVPGGDKLVAMRISAIERHLADPATPAMLLPHYERRLDGYLSKATGFQSRSEADFTDELRNALEASVQGVVDALEALLAKDVRPFIAGDAYSVVDCLWTALLARISFIGLPSWWAGAARPFIAAYVHREDARATELRERRRDARANPQLTPGTADERLHAPPPTERSDCLARYSLARHKGHYDW
jgi:glutathione S-transferase